MNKKEFYDLSERVRKEIPIDDLLEVKVGINPGGKRRCPCPFHANARPGSFSTFQSSSGKYYYNCFQCGAQGDNIKLVQELDKVSFQEAVLSTACEFKLITPEEYKKESKKDFTSTTHDIKKPVKSRTAETANPFLIDIIYRQLSKGMSFVDKSLPKLSEQHREYLHGRGIFDDEIERYGYFTMPTDSNRMIEGLRIFLESKGLDETYLLGIPGFYRFRESGKIGMVCPSGIGIPLRDVGGRITAIQIRHDVLLYPDAPRYTAFSSSMVNSGNQAKWMEMGCGPKDMLSVLYPDSNEHPNKVLITEGQFKAAKWADLKKMITITVQGVNNTNGIEKTLLHLEQEKHVDTVIIGFDADLLSNINVFKAEIKLRKLIESIQRYDTDEKFKVLYLAWKEEYGKGIDDVILAGNKSKFRLIDPVKWERAVIKQNGWKDLQ